MSFIMQSTIVNDAEATRASLLEKYKEDDEKISSRLNEIMKESNKLNSERRCLGEMMAIDYAKLSGFLEMADKIDIITLDKTFKQMESMIKITDQTYAERMCLKNAYEYASRQLMRNGNQLIKKIEAIVIPISGGISVILYLTYHASVEKLRAILRNSGMSDEEIRVAFTFWREVDNLYDMADINALAEGK